MRIHLLARAACASAALALAACGSSPTEPMSMTNGRETMLRVVVTKCDLGGSVTVHTEMGLLGTLPTPGEAAFTLPPGPHTLSWKRGQDSIGGSVLNGAGDPVASIAPGTAAAITLVDPMGACSAVAH